MTTRPDSELCERLDALQEFDAENAQILRSELSLGKPDSSAPPQDDCEASTQIRSWLNEDELPDIVIAAGAAGTLLPARLLETIPKSCKVLIIERHPSHALQLFSGLKLEEFVAEGKVVMAIGEDKTEATEKLGAMLDLPKKPVVRILDMIEYSPGDESFYYDILMEIRNNMRVSMLNLSTLVNLGPLWQKNTLINLPLLLRNPGLDALENKFTGKPAIVAAAGPSLSRAIEILKEVRDNYFLICVGTALRPLREAGIKPDLVVTADASKKTLKQFETQCDDLYLATSMIACPEVLPKFKGLFSGHGSANSVGKWISSLGVLNGRLYGGGTVSTTAIDMAKNFGCNPIVTVGLDLCMADSGSTHAENSMYDGMKTENYSRNILTVPGNYSDSVTTTGQFRAYIDIISDYARKYTEVRFINVNDHGARIEGMELASLEELRSISSEHQKAMSVIQDIHCSHNVDSSADRVIEELTDCIEQIDDILSISTRAAMTCNRLIAMLRRPRSGDMEEADTMLTELQAAGEKIMAVRGSSMLIDMALRPAYFSIGMKPMEHEAIYSDAILANMESRRLFQEVGKACQWTRNLLTDTELQLKQVNRSGAGDQDRNRAACGLHAA